jgi:hypothetical protein
MDLGEHHGRYRAVRRTLEHGLQQANRLVVELNLNGQKPEPEIGMGAGKEGMNPLLEERLANLPHVEAVHPGPRIHGLDPVDIEHHVVRVRKQRFFRFRHDLHHGGALFNRGSSGLGRSERDSHQTDLDGKPRRDARCQAPADRREFFHGIPLYRFLSIGEGNPWPPGDRTPPARPC